MDGFGRRIQDCRQRQGMKQEELAELSKLSTAFISAIERGVKKPSLEAFIRIANALNVSSDELLMDCLEVRFDIRSSELGQMIEVLKRLDREAILDVVEVMIRHAEKGGVDRQRKV